MSDIQQAVGQLMIYEQLLGEKYQKVLVVPNALQEEYAAAVTALDISVLYFRREGRTIVIDRDELSRLFS